MLSRQVLGLLVLGSSLLVGVSYFKANPEGPKRRVHSVPLAVHNSGEAKFANQLLVASHSKSTSQELRTLIQQGHDFFDQENYPQAIRRYQEALSRQADLPIVLTDLGTAYFHLNKPSQAIKYYHQALKVAPQHYDAYVNLGFAYVTLNQSEQAKNTWKKGLQLQYLTLAQRQTLTHLLEAAPK